MNKNNKEAIKIHDLTVAYNDEAVLWDIDLSIPKGELIGIIGPNGAGKSTLIKSILGLVKPISGSIKFNDGLEEEICYVPQSESIDWDFPINVFDTVLMGTYKELGWIKRPKKTHKKRTKEALKKLKILDLKDRQISELSGGQRQRVFLARALVQRAEIYFLDEPFKGVDINTEEIIINLLKSLRDEGKTILVVHHDLATVRDYYDQVILLNKRLIKAGRVSEVFNEENIGKTYNKKEGLI